MKLRTNSTYFIYLTIFVFLLTFGLAIASIISHIVSPSEDILWFYIWVGTLLFFSIVVLILGLYENKYGVCTEESLTIRNLFKEIKEIKWQDIIKISVENRIAAGNSRGYVITEYYFVIYTDQSQSSFLGGINKSKKGPWQLHLNEKNLDALDYYMSKYGVQGIFMKNDAQKVLDFVKKRNRK